jgi:acetylornithine/succinyldiaminopimelate/putrescine aminotransferase
MEEEDLLEKVTKRSESWHKALAGLVEKHPKHLKGLRGVGYHAALVVDGDPLPWVGRLRDNGLLVVRGGTDAIRLMPPLNVSQQDLDTAVEILDFVFGTQFDS